MEPFFEGQCFAFDVTPTIDDIDRFAALSGDHNPLHMSAAFARARGFADRVVHGALLGSYVSRMAGMYCPGTDALLHSMSIQFKQPAYPGNALRVHAEVDQVSWGTNTIVLKITIVSLADGAVHATGKVQVGLTQPAPTPP